jgi:hypothetical protein
LEAAARKSWGGLAEGVIRRLDGFRRITLTLIRPTSYELIGYIMSSPEVEDLTKDEFVELCRRAASRSSP